MDSARVSNGAETFVEVGNVEGESVQRTVHIGDNSVREEHAAVDTGSNELGDVTMVEDDTAPSSDVRTVIDEVVSPSDISASSDEETVRKCVRALASESVEIHKAAVTALKLGADCTHGGGGRNELAWACKPCVNTLSANFKVVKPQNGVLGK